ncbi:MAG: DivIVA domain-containing protein [Actinomycetota bacterium]|nr:DivIVA domain-containing protein [Actinomycetota bacterium]
MLPLELLVVAVVVATAIMVARGRGDGLAPAPPDAGGVGIGPTGRVEAAEVAELRFGLAFRGYRMAEVDFVLARLAEQLRARDDELATLRGAGPALPAGSGADG